MEARGCCREWGREEWPQAEGNYSCDASSEPEEVGSWLRASR